jgi:nitroreductase / dihydropteridine reductase
MNLLSLLQWRYATKRMNGKKVPSEKLDRILEAIRLSASSLGLQPYSIFVIEDETLRKQLRIIAHNQAQIEECSHLLVFAAWDNVTPKHIEDLISEIASQRNLPLDSLNDFKNRVIHMVSANTQEQNHQWAARQVYIALGTGLIAAASEEVDATPMEGFDNEAMDNFLNLKDLNLKSIAIMPLGYRNPETDWLMKLPKVRRQKEKLFIYR